MRGEEERADSRRNRTQILAAFSRLLADSPDATVAEVAAEAGVARATVYRHFPSRDALLDALLTHEAGIAIAQLLDEMETLPLDDALDTLARGVVELAHEHRKLLAATTRRLEDLARTAVADEPVVALLARRRATGELRSPLPDEWLGACIRALCLAASAGEGRGSFRADHLATSLRRLVAE